jgi:hypothetical protein
MSEPVLKSGQNWGVFVVDDRHSQAVVPTAVRQECLELLRGKGYKCELLTGQATIDGERVELVVIVVRNSVANVAHALQDFLQGHV